MRAYKGRNLRVFRGVIFDLDGTIVEHTLNYEAARRDVALLLSRHGVIMENYENLRILEMVEKAESFLEHTGGGRGIEAAKRDALVVLCRYEREAAEKTRVLPDAVAALTSLRGRGLKTGLVTNNHRFVVDRVLTRFALSQLFDVTICRDDANSFKPSPFPLLLAIKRIGLVRTEALYVGDSTVDAAAAGEAGLAFAGVLTGVSDRDAFSGVNTRFIIESLAELPLLIREAS